MPRIYISPSNQHSNKYSAGNTNEMEQCTKIANALADVLEQNGFSVMVANGNDSMSTRAKNSDNFNADIHLPIHTNAYNGNYTGGTRIFVLNQNNRKPAQCIMNYLGKISVGEDDNITYNTRLYEINVPRAKTVYIECEFHDTAKGAKWIINNTQNIANAIAHGLCDYFGINFNKNNSIPKSKNSATIEYGNTNISVLLLKKILIHFYNKKIIKTKPDNSAGFGNGTLKAIKEFQKYAKIEVDGIVGNDTVNAIYKYL